MRLSDPDPHDGKQSVEPTRDEMEALRFIINSRASVILCGRARQLGLQELGVGRA